MAFLTYQPEILSSINFIPGFRIGGWPATLLGVALFLGLSIIGTVFLRRRLSVPAVLIAAALVAWLPAGSRFAYSALRDFRESRFLLARPLDERIIWRYCAIDKTEDIKGFLCGLYPFMQAVRERVPAHSLIMVADSELKPYVAYYLYDGYRLTEDPTAARYLIIYAPRQPFAFQQGQLFQRGSPEPLGRYRLISAFSADQLIFERL